MIGVVGFIAGCRKSGIEPPLPPVLNPPGTPNLSLKLSYTDSIFYLKPGSSNIITSQPMNRLVQFFGFPDGIEINENTVPVELPIANQVFDIKLCLYQLVLPIQSVPKSYYQG